MENRSVGPPDHLCPRCLLQHEAGHRSVHRSRITTAEIVGQQYLATTPNVAYTIDLWLEWHSSRLRDDLTLYIKSTATPVPSNPSCNDYFNANCADYRHTDSALWGLLVQLHNTLLPRLSIS